MQKFTLIPGGVTAPAGFRAAGIHAGLKRQKKDLAILVSDYPARATGVFTTNRVQAAPLKVCQEHLATHGEMIRAVVINSGNANACTGPQGLADAREMAATTAAGLGVEPSQVLVASTGVIGVPLPLGKIRAGIATALTQLSPAGAGDAAAAIMTTDTMTKEVALEFSLGDRHVRLGGMAKGSGMIHPNLATMLAFFTTDLAITRDLLTQALKEAVASTFNMITVDGDTSTNDMVLLLANGRAGNPCLTEPGPDYALFVAALTEAATILAKLIARDGEGATKLVEVIVKGAPNLLTARTVARAVAGSNLVKTAIFGEDANWGRILCAAGYSGATFDPDRVNIFLGPVQVAAGGQAHPFSEVEAKAVLAQKEVQITLDLQAGTAEARAWTCDLTYEYVRINASYRT